MESLCLASRHNARQGRIVDHRLLRGLSVGLQGFLFIVVVGHDLLHHLLELMNWAFHDLWLGASTVVSSIRVRICGMRTSTSSAPLPVSRSPWLHCHGLATHGSATMRDVHLSWDVDLGSLDVLCGAVWSLLCELPTASLADQTWVYCGY